MIKSLLIITMLMLLLTLVLYTTAVIVDNINEDAGQILFNIAIGVMALVAMILTVTLIIAVITLI